MRLIGAAVAAVLATTATGQDLRTPDAERMSRYIQSFGTAMFQALNVGDRAALDALATAMQGRHQDTLEFTGEWSCRWIKVGGVLGVVSYRPFKCRISETDTGWTVEKLTGSQRFVGDLYPEDGAFLYVGVAFVGDKPSTDYAGLPPDNDTPVAPNFTFAQVGYFEQSSPTSARLLLPEPLVESKFDVFHFTR